MPLRNVLRIQFDHFFKVGDFAPSADLPHAGDSGLDGEPCAVVILVFFPLIHCRRSRAYEGHIAFQNIEELRKFVA